MAEQIKAQLLRSQFLFFTKRTGNELQFICKTVETSGRKMRCGVESRIESVFQLPTGNLSYRLGYEIVGGALGGTDADIPHSAPAEMQL